MEPCPTIFRHKFKDFEFFPHFNTDRTKCDLMVLKIQGSVVSGQNIDTNGVVIKLKQSVRYLRLKHGNGIPLQNIGSPPSLGDQRAQK